MGPIGLPRDARLPEELTPDMNADGQGPLGAV